MKPVLVMLFVIVISISIPGMPCAEIDKNQHDPCCTNQHCVRAYYDHNYDKWHIQHGYCESSHYKEGAKGYGSSHHGSNSNSDGHYSNSNDHNYCYYDGCLYTGLCYYDYKTNSTKVEESIAEAKLGGEKVES